MDRYDKQDKFFLAGYNNVAFDNDFLRQFFKEQEAPYFGAWFWAGSIDVMVVLAADHLQEVSMYEVKKCPAAHPYLSNVDSPIGMYGGNRHWQADFKSNEKREAELWVTLHNRRHQRLKEEVAAF